MGYDEKFMSQWVLVGPGGSRKRIGKHKKATHGLKLIMVYEHVVVVNERKTT